MNCQEVRTVMDGYLDGELGPIHNREIEGHLQGCALCSNAYHAQQALQAAIRSSALYVKSPVALHKRIRSSLRQGRNHEFTQGHALALGRHRSLTRGRGRADVAPWVYKRREHVINLFIWPITHASSEDGKPVTSQGYHHLHWSHSGMSFWAVSDLNTRELQEFVRLLQTQLAR